MSTQHPIVDASVEALKSPVPTASIGTAVVLGYPLSDWVLVLSALYTLLQFAAWIWDRVIKPKWSKDDDPSD